jgi:hypothetical protein
LAGSDAPGGVAGALSGAFDLESSVFAFDDSGVGPGFAFGDGRGGDLGPANGQRVIQPGGEKILGG